MANTKKDRNTSEQPLSKTLSFLSSMASTCASLSVLEIADELRVSKPTAYSIVNSLVSQGYLEKNNENGKYHIGYLFYALGQNYPRMYPFLMYADSYAQALYKRLGLRINICVYKEPMTALVVASKDPSLVPRHTAGYMLPAHLSASGKVLLASLPKNGAAECIRAATLYPATQKTITDAETLLQQLEEVRTHGYACDIEEFVPGNVCVAAPIFNASGTVVSTLSIANCPVERFNAEREALIQDVKNTTLQISVDMGYPRDSNFRFAF